MHDENEIELTAEERNMLSALPRQIEPGRLLEERVVRALRSEGHFGAHASKKRGLMSVLKIAAAVALFAGGVATGRYLLMPDAPQSASATRMEPIRATDSARPAMPTIPAGGETIVAEREIWM